MVIVELTTTIPPPSQPVETGTVKAWQEVLQQLKIELPDDYRDFGMAYGTGAFEDVGRLDIWVYNPFSPRYFDSIWSHLHNLDALKVGEGDRFVPYDIFPKSPGLLVWGSDVNGNEMFWLTKGRPSDWPIVVRSPEGQFLEFDGPLTSFLAKAFRRQLAVAVWPEPFFSEPGNIRFRPETPTPHIDVSPRTLYELYVENGCKANFWTRQINAQEGVFYLIKAIAGKTAGTLSGIPVEYERQHVAADLYLGATRFETDINMTHAYQPVFIRVDPPSGLALG